MSGVDAASWMESFKDYLEPVTTIALDVKDKLEGYDYPPAVVDAYKTTATAIGAEDISPVYVGFGVVAASGFLLLACRSCQAAPKKKKGRGSKKSKARAKAAANGSVQKNGGSGKGGPVAAAGGAAANGGSGARDLAGKKPKPAAGGAQAAAPKASKKAPATAPQPQGKGKSKGKKKPVVEAPPVITEEPEAAKKLNKKKERAAKKAKAAAAAAAEAAASKTTSKNNSTAANGSTPGGAGPRQAYQNGGGDAGEAEPWGAQHAGGEWQTGPMGSQEGEWETVSHKRSKPRKEKAAVDDANTIPGGLGL